MIRRGGVSIFIGWEMSGWPGDRVWKTWKWIQESNQSRGRESSERGPSSGMREKKEKMDTASLSVKTGGDWVAQRNKVGDEDDLKKGKCLAIMEKLEWQTLGSVITCSMWWKEARLRETRKCDTGNNLVSSGIWTGWLRSFLPIKISDRCTISVLYGSAIVLWKYGSAHWLVRWQCVREKHFKNLCIWGEFPKCLCIHTYAYNWIPLYS